MALSISLAARAHMSHLLLCRLQADAPLTYIPTLYFWSAAGAAGDSLATPLNRNEAVPDLNVIVAKFVQKTAAGLKYVDKFTEQVIESKGKNCARC